MVREYVLFNAYNSSFTLVSATSFCPSYFMTQKASVAPRVFTIRQVIQIDGLASGSSTITRVRRAKVVMP